MGGSPSTTRSMPARSADDPHLVEAEPSPEESTIPASLAGADLQHERSAPAPEPEPHRATTASTAPVGTQRLVWFPISHLRLRAKGGHRLRRRTEDSIRPDPTAQQADPRRDSAGVELNSQLRSRWRSGRRAGDRRRGRQSSPGHHRARVLVGDRESDRSQCRYRRRGPGTSSPTRDQGERTVDEYFRLGARDQRPRARGKQQPPESPFTEHVLQRLAP